MLWKDMFCLVDFVDKPAHFLMSFDILDTQWKLCKTMSKPFPSKNVSLLNVGVSNQNTPIISSHC